MWVRIKVDELICVFYESCGRFYQRNKNGDYYHFSIFFHHSLSIGALHFFCVNFQAFYRFYASLSHYARIAIAVGRHKNIPIFFYQNKQLRAFVISAPSAFFQLSLGGDFLTAVNTTFLSQSLIYLFIFFFDVHHKHIRLCENLFVREIAMIFLLLRVLLCGRFIFLFMFTIFFLHLRSSATELN